MTKRPGPIGTKLGLFIIDDKLEISNDYYSIAQYDKYLKTSIELGLTWLKKHVPILSSAKYKNLLINIEDQISKYNYTESINQKIIELSYDVLDNINKIATHPEKKSSVLQKNNHLGPENLDKISIEDIDPEMHVLVETHLGNFVLFLYVKHNDHWDILPYKYIIEKIPNFKFEILNNIEIKIKKQKY